MTFKDWTKHIIGHLDELSDEEYQSRIWVRGEGPECSSFTEVVCGLFDDQRFDQYVRDIMDEANLDEKEWCSVTEFKDTLNSFVTRVEGISDDVQIINDPQWPMIVSQARMIRDILMGMENGDTI